MDHPMRVERRQRDKDKYRPRYRQAIQMALKWMDRHKATQQFLADHLTVNRTTLSKFLSETPGFHPAGGRPVMVNILERIESVCADIDLDLVAEEYLPPVEAEEANDDYEWFRHHTVRLRQLPKLDPVTALGRVPELCAQACNGPRGYRSAMTLNTIMRLAFVLERPEAECATPRLFRQTADRIRRLADVALQYADEIDKDDVRAAVPHRAHGYSGYGLAYCGLYGRDDALIVDGLERLGSAVVMQHPRTAGHWANLFRVVDTLLARQVEGAGRVADHTGRLALAGWDENIEYTVANRSYPRLVDHWESQAPELAIRFGGKVSS
jgi:hypothetical protein